MAKYDFLLKQLEFVGLIVLNHLSLCKRNSGSWLCIGQANGCDFLATALRAGPHANGQVSAAIAADQLGAGGVHAALVAVNARIARHRESFLVA
jgi:hypothetical protein